MKLVAPFVALAAALAAGCSLPVAIPRPASVPSIQAQPARIAAPSRCGGFSPAFYELVACERTDGTLGSFTHPNVARRVRYFVRYERMPCGEFPTVQEAYVFHMIEDDLQNDSNLTNAQRLAIRKAMFSGIMRC